MYNAVDLLSSIDHLKSPANIQDDVSSVSSNDHKFNNMVSDSFNKISSTDTDFEIQLDKLIQSPGAASNPESLLSWQNYLGEYNNYISLVSALTRKAVSTIETLEKSQ